MTQSPLMAALEVQKAIDLLRQFVSDREAFGGATIDDAITLVCDEIERTKGMVMVPEEPECAHLDKETGWDCLFCRSCGGFRTDSTWGIASNQWFKSRDEAEFYKRNGRRPE